jgi:hypothetical protein
MSGNFGTNQGPFGSAPNQYKSQNVPTPGIAPATGGGPFGNLGANTTNSAAFGGAGAGSTPAGGGTTSGTPGSNIFATGGSAFGGAGNTTTAPTLAGPGAATGSPFGGGAGLFPGEYRSSSIFLK